MGQSNGRHTNHEEQAADNHHGFAAQKIRQRPGKQGGNHAPEQNSGDDERKLTGIQAGRGFQIRQGTRNDADIHPEKQPAQARHQEQKTVIARLR